MGMRFPTVFCLLLLCMLDVNSAVDPYGLDYFIAVGGELTAVFFGPVGKIAAMSPFLTDAVTALQHYSPFISLRRGANRLFKMACAGLQVQSNGSIAGVWDPMQKCFASLESRSDARSLFSQSDFSYSEGLYISDLDLAFLQSSLSKRAARFQCLDSASPASSFAQCGYDSRMQLDMTSTAGDALSRAFTVAKATGDLQGHVLFLADIATQINVTAAALNTSGYVVPLEAQLEYLQTAFSGFDADASALLSGMWEVFRGEFAVIESDLDELEEMWIAANIWNTLGEKSFAESRNASATFKSLVSDIKDLIAKPAANFSTALHMALTDNMINYTVSLIDRLFYFGTLDSDTAPLLQLELETFAKMLTGHYFIVTLDSLITYRAYVQAIGDGRSTAADLWDSASYTESYALLVSLAEYFYTFMGYFINAGPYTDCLMRKMAEFARINLAPNATDAAKDGGFFPGMFTGLYSCRIQTDLHRSAFFRFDTGTIADLSLGGRAWEIKLIQSLTLIEDTPSSIFGANNSVIRLSTSPQSFGGTRREVSSAASPRVESLRHNSSHLKQLRRASRQSWSESCTPGYYRNASSVCDVCPIGTFSPGDGLLHLCYNAPEANTTYVATQQVSADCAFVCLEEDKYRSGNSCALIPVGFASLDGGGLVPCTAPYGAAFALFSSPGGRSVNDCTHTLAYQAVIEAGSDAAGFRADFLFDASFTLELWLRWRSPSFPSASQSLSIGLLGIPDLWSWELLLINSSVRLLFRMNAANFAAASIDASLLLDVQWHHLALVADAEQSALVFYVDGREKGYSYYSPQLIQPSTTVPPSRLYVSGVRSTQQEWLRADIDEIRIYRTRVPPPLLGVRFAARAVDLSCEGGDPQQATACLATCPAETTRNATELALDLAPLTSPADWAPAAFSAVCRCPPGQEWYLSQCISECSGGAVRREWEECVCPEGQYQVWDASGLAFLFVSIACNDTKALSLTSIEVKDSSDTILTPLACAAQNVPLVCPSSATPYAIPPSGAVVRLHLGDPHELGSIVVRLDGVGARNATVSLSLATSPLTTPLYIASSIPAQQGANVFATRLFTPSSSPLLKCIACPADTAGTRYPRSSLADCLCVTGTVRSEAMCVPALPALDAPLIAPTDQIPYPSPLLLSLAYGGNSTPDSYFVVSVIASRYFTVVLSLHSPFLLLTEPSIVVAYVTSTGRLPSLATTKEYTLLPKAPLPVLRSPIPYRSIHTPTAVALSLDGAIAATPGARFYLTIDGNTPSELSPWVALGQAIVIARQQTIRARTYLPGYFLSDEVTLQFPYNAGGGVCVLCIVLPIIAVLVLAAVALVVLRVWFWSQTVSTASRFAACISAELRDIWDCIDGDEMQDEEQAEEREMDVLYD